MDGLPAVAAYLRRINARARSFCTAVVEAGGEKYKREVGTIRFFNDGRVECSRPEDEPDQRELQEIGDALRRIEFPTHQTLTALHSLPDELKNVPPESLFNFKDDQGRFVMIQQRIETDGPRGKAYVPWTYWSDNQWRRMEPEGPLPLWGLEQLADHDIVFIHEGAKAARAIRDQLDGRAPVTCPWLEDMKHGAHIGWIGGAPNPHRTDWSPLRRAKRVYIVADNDPEGVHAVPHIARELRCPTFQVQFGNDWPSGFDLGDPFPAKMFKNKLYAGPSFMECLVPATWATDEHIVPAEGRGRPRTTYTLRRAFAEQWIWVEDQDVYASVELARVYRREVFNGKVRPFSHAADTARLLQQYYTGQKASLTYRPDRPTERLISDGGKLSLNMYRPPFLRPVPGDVSPFIAFLEYLFPKEEERAHVTRWIATVAGKPERRALYGLMALSQTQGVGKTILGSILAALVGPHNTSFPGEQEISNSTFNSWLKNVRLVVVNEIYAGENWKTYNRLKTAMTDDPIEVNEKFMTPVKIPNWTHYYACSNDPRAMKVDNKDRRWLVPTVTEDKWPRERFETLLDWLQAGGLSHVLSWAQNYGDHIKPGEEAPATERKAKLIEDSRSAEFKEARDIGEALMHLAPERRVILTRDVAIQVAERLGRGKRPWMADIHAGLAEAGMFLRVEQRKRVRINGRLESLAANFDIADASGRDLGPLLLSPLKLENETDGRL